jgi:hypothetical protein
MSTSSLTASASESFVIPDTAPSENDEVDSLPSISSSVLDSEEDYSDAQREWEESLEQLQLLLTMIIMPFAGKYFGRKFAYWSGCPRFHAGVKAELLLTLAQLQVGQGTWSGCTMSRSGGRALPASRRPAPYKLHLHYDSGVDGPIQAICKYRLEHWRGLSTTAFGSYGLFLVTFRSRSCVLTAPIILRISLL